MKNNDGIQVGGNIEGSNLSNKVTKTDIKYIRKISFWSGFGGGIISSIIVGILLLIIEYGLFNK